MGEHFDRLHGMAGRIFDLASAAGTLSWDMQTYMPPGGADGRAHSLATLASLAHEFFVRDDFGEALEAAEAEIKDLDPDSDEAGIVARLRRDFDKGRRVPSEWVAESERTVGLAFSAWIEARQASDFAAFQPHIEKVLEVKRSYVSFFEPYDSPYDPLLDDYEPGLKLATVRQIFSELREVQIPLVQAISERSGAVDDSFLRVAYDEKAQWDFGLEVIRDLGYDFDRGRQDKAPHPFSQALNRGDVRITNRVNPNHFGSALFGSMHEAGHAIYSQGIAPALDRIPSLSGSTLDSAHDASLGIHESQSRMLENFVGRSRAFWTAYYPRLQAVFPEQLGDIEVDAFYRAINKVDRSLIRVEADEATYNLHILLRFEIEADLIEGNLAVADLPEAWNSKFKEYLGITPPDDRRGVLQDIHWSDGYFGYFPTYTLGNIICAQLWQKLSADVPDLEAQISRGDFKELIGWLHENVHRHGGKYEPMVLLKRVTGQELSAKPYLEYLSGKYSEIYGLS
ncbi:MAG: carboxypeptidase M32 [Anaerolineae bacterium]|nr:MAG: carboxypeptidase M32 [Anaerolineae bacterium]